MIVSITIKNWMSFKDKTFSRWKPEKRNQVDLRKMTSSGFVLSCSRSRLFSDQMVPANLISLKQFHSYSVC